MVLERPTFLVLGAGKAGSTSLAYFLDQHPQIAFSYPKEPPFFQIEYEKGMDYYWRSYYRAYAGEPEAGEAAHQNLRLPYVARRIHESLPDARLIVICRDPVERALSAYWHNYTRRLDRRSFDDAIAENLRRLETGPFFEDEKEAELYAEAARRQAAGGEVAYASYIDSGYYARHIERYAALFGWDRIKILLFDDLVRSPQAVADAAYAHLGLEPVTLEDVQAQNTPIHPALASVFKVVTALPGLDRIPGSWRARARTLLSTSFGSAKPEMSAETRRQLGAHFRPYNQRLAEITGRNLDHWNGMRSGLGEPAATAFGTDGQQPRPAMTRP